MLLFAHLPAQADSTLRVLTYNVWGLPAPLSKNLRSRMEGLCTQLKHEAEHQTWDVVLLQEVWRPWIAKLLSDCGYPYSLRLDRGSFETGLMILSLHPMLGGSRHIFESKPTGLEAVFTGESISSKGVLSTIVLHPALGEFFVANTHLVANYGPKLTFDRYRMDQLREVANIMVRDGVMRGRPIPRILGGDLNVAPEGPSYTLLWELLPVLLPGYRRFVSPLPVSTRDDSNPYVKEDEGHLDHLFGLKGARPVSGSVVFDAPGTYFSDHYGWETEFEFR